MHPGTMAASRPEKTAIIDGAGAWSYRWLDAASRTLAQQARASGLKRGDTLGIFAPNGAVFLAAAWAAQRSGLYALPLGLRLTPADLGYVLKDSGARLVYSSSALAGVQSLKNNSSVLLSSISWRISVIRGLSMRWQVETTRNHRQRRERKGIWKLTHRCSRHTVMAFIRTTSIWPLN